MSSPKKELFVVNCEVGREYVGTFGPFNSEDEADAWVDKRQKVITKRLRQAGLQGEDSTLYSIRWLDDPVVSLDAQSDV